jgi:hypothetical protein
VEVLKYSFERRGKDIQAAWSLVKYLDQNKDGKISESEWVTMGEQVGLIQAILGDEFLAMMERFSIPGKQQRRDLSRKTIRSSSMNNEGDLAVLLPELRREIFFHLDDFKTIIRAMRVNSRWKKEMEECWYSLCKKKNFLEHEEWWKSRSKSWKWVFKTKFVSEVNILLADHF